jgi:hypothetical protein
MSESRKAAVVEALHELQARLTAAHLAGKTSDAGELARDFNALLQQAKESFPGSDTLRLIEPLHADAGTPVLAVRLVMMRRTIELELDDSSASERRETRRGDERRRWQRRDVTWSARFLLGEGAVIAARAVDASRHGLRLVLDGVAPGSLTHGQRCGVEVYLSGSSARFFRDAEVCHIDEHGIGLAIRDPLPPGLVPLPGDPGAPSAATPAVTAPRGVRARLWGLLRR